MANELDFTDGVIKFGSLERGNIFHYPNAHSVAWIKTNMHGGLNAVALDDGISVEMGDDENVTRVSRVIITSED